MREYSWNSAVARPLPPTRVDKEIYGEKQARPLHKGFSVGEKLLYLFSIILCVSLALIVISKHAKVAELNLGIRNIETHIQELNKRNVQLEAKQEQLSSIETVRNFAENKGLELSLPKMLPS